MAAFGIRLDTEKSLLKKLHPRDPELHSLILETINLIILKIEFGDKASHFYQYEWEAYGLQLAGIRYTNPFDIWGTIKGISRDTGLAVLERTLFYKKEAERRELENQLTRQDIISRKLDNIEKADALRKRLLDGGQDPDEAMRVVGEILADQHAKLVPGNPRDLPPEGPDRTTRLGKD